MTGPDPERVWERGWKGHETAQRKRMASLSLAEKIAWLESAQVLVERLRTAREARRPPGGDERAS